MTTPQLPDAEIEARVKAAEDRMPWIGDTITRDGHELMWDSGQWVHSPDCHHEQLNPAAIRARLMLSLEEMAVKLGVSSSTVWRWEHGIKPIARHRRKLFRLADFDRRYPGGALPDLQEINAIKTALAALDRTRQ